MINHEHIFFKSGGITLEGVLSHPQKSSSCPGVIICHPHPLYGGDMNNNVVLGIKEALETEEFLILRFNFRGVTLSEGKYDEGKGEVDDVIAAVNFLSSHAKVDRNRIFLVGYSFGAWVGLQAALTINALRAVAGIAPPCGLYDFNFLHDNALPILFVRGDHDTFCNKKEFEIVFDKIFSSKKKVILPQSDHFFFGREGEIGEEVKRFFLSCL
ncbi:MAG: prolyl oligopeptidase family serine peptidase [Thermodesulfobacteriota bacterium]|jgi:alpha/beta superfamily hydrolase|nr:MAG: prolyl oligopeptidase family serine peptidase [Thermodesulfobacteriota bacterium]